MRDDLWRLTGNASELARDLKALGKRMRSLTVMLAVRELMAAGFTSERRGYSFPDEVEKIASEAKSWLKTRDNASPVLTCAVDLLSAWSKFQLAYERSYNSQLKAGRSDRSDEWKRGELTPYREAIFGRCLMAAVELGNAETLFHVAKADLIDHAALALIRKEKARERGRSSGRTRRENRQPNRARARKAWQDYTGKLPRTRWAKRNATRFGVAWRTLDTWLTT
jgi:hypothetical protein